LLSSSELFHQLIDDRHQDLRRSAAAGRNARPSAVRRKVARSLRRAADRLDQAAAAPGPVSGAHPGRG
jgi:hypothetical protein